MTNTKYSEDAVVQKLETALQNAESVNLRGSIKSAIERRKREIRESE